MLHLNLIYQIINLKDFLKIRVSRNLICNGKRKIDLRVYERNNIWSIKYILVIIILKIFKHENSINHRLVFLFFAIVFCSLKISAQLSVIQTENGLYQDIKMTISAFLKESLLQLRRLAICAGKPLSLQKTGPECWNVEKFSGKSDAKEAWTVHDVDRRIHNTSWKPE